MPLTFPSIGNGAEFVGQVVDLPQISLVKVYTSSEATSS
jgi:hypothetical protein